MTTEDKVCAIFRLIVEKTYPKDQFGFYSEEQLMNDIRNILQQP